jgi:predicted DNA-binding transcriptional regulator
MIPDLLSQIGLGEKEVTIYLAVLRHGKISPAELARVTKIKRTTVYSVTQELLRLGIISADHAGTTQSLLALPPEELRQVIFSEERALADRRELVEKAVTGLKELAKDTKYAIPKITFIGEEGLEQYLYRQTPVWNQSLLATDPIWWGFQATSFVAEYGEWIDWYWKTGTTPGISLQLLSDQSDVEAEMAGRKYAARKIRFWGNQTDFTATTWICGDHLIMVQTDKKPYFLVDIADATLAHNQREVFKEIWRGLVV